MSISLHTAYIAHSIIKAGPTNLYDFTDAAINKTLKKKKFKECKQGRQCT